MVNSKFSRGLIAADSNSLRTQVAMWEDMKLWRLLWKKARGSLSDTDLVQQELNEKADWLGRFDDDQIRVMLLTRIGDHLDINLPQEMTAGDIDDIGSKIEEETIELLRENDDDFGGDTTSEMAQHVMQELFKDLTDRFEEQDEETRGEIVSAILKEIESMPKEERERLRNELDVDELSREAIRKAIVSGSLGTAFASVVQVAGFGAYMAAVKALAAAAGLVGITVPFSVYATLTSAIAVAANPLFVVPALLGGGWLLTRYTNNKMRNNLLPVLVTQSTVQAAVNDYSSSNLASFVESYDDILRRYLEAKENGKSEEFSKLEDKYAGISSIHG